MEKRKDWGLILAVSLLIIGLVVIFFPFNVLDGLSAGKFTLKVDKYSDLGAFISGLTTPFLSISAFILLYLTYNSQKKELAASKAILERQSETLETQQFETTFFNLVNLHHSIVNSTDVKVPVSPMQRMFAINKGQSINPEIKHGRDCFVFFFYQLENCYKKTKEQYSENSPEAPIVHAENEIIGLAYEEFFSEYYSDLGHYFRNLYHIVKFIEGASFRNKQKYIGILRAQLSTHELLILFYNGLSNYGEKFKPLIEKYHFLQNMPKEDILSSGHLSLYSSEAYGD